MGSFRYSPVHEKVEVFDWETGEFLKKHEITSRMNEQDINIKKILSTLDGELEKYKSMRDSSVVADISYIALKNLKRKII